MRRCVRRHTHERTHVRRARARAAQPTARECMCLPHREDPSGILPLAMPKKNLLGTSVGCRGTGHTRRSTARTVIQLDPNVDKMAPQNSNSL